MVVQGRVGKLQGWLWDVRAGGLNGDVIVVGEIDTTARL